MPPQTSSVRACLDAVIAEMHREGVWDVAEPHVDLATAGAFGMNAMAFVQWLRWVFVPNVERLVASDGPWPATSAVAAQATREGDTDAAIAALVPSLAAFDALFAIDATELARHARVALDGNDFDTAAATIRDALAADPDVANGENLAGWIEYARPNRSPAQLDDAIAHFRRAVARGVDVAAIVNLATALVAADRSADAIAALEALAEAGSAEAHNWLGWWSTEKQPDVPRALAHLEAATTLRPAWGVAWSNFAKALDASGDVARACAAFSTAIECGDAPDEPYARDRRVQLEMILRSRGERPPPPPLSARVDTAAIEVLAAAATNAQLSHSHTFVLMPTTGRPPRGEGAFAVICIVADGRTSCATIVIDRGAWLEACTQTRGDDPTRAITLRRTPLDGKGGHAADHLAAWLGAQITGELGPLDAALALRIVLAAQLPNSAGWWPRVVADDPAGLAIGRVGTGLVLGVRARAGGGVVVELAPEAFGATGALVEVPTVAELAAQLPGIIEATRRAIAASDEFADRAWSVRRLSAAVVAALRADDAHGWRDPDIDDRYPRDCSRAYVRSAREGSVAIELVERADDCAMRLDDQRWSVRSAAELPIAEVLAAAHAAVARLRWSQIALHERFRVISPFGSFAVGELVEVVEESFDPRGESRTIALRGDRGARDELSEATAADQPILAAIHRYLVRASSPTTP